VVKSKGKKVKIASLELEKREKERVRRVTVEMGRELSNSYSAGIPSVHSVKATAEKRDFG